MNPAHACPDSFGTGIAPTHPINGGWDGGRPRSSPPPTVNSSQTRSHVLAGAFIHDCGFTLLSWTLMNGVGLVH